MSLGVSEFFPISCLLRSIASTISFSSLSRNFLVLGWLLIVLSRQVNSGLFTTGENGFQEKLFLSFDVRNDMGVIVDFEY